MELHELKPAEGATKHGFRVGRGIGSGKGKTSGRGHKGQKSRSGYSRKRGFEGGQMPLQRTMPKRGFHNVFKKDIVSINLERLNVFAAGTVVTPELLKEVGIVSNLRDGVKILGRGEALNALTVKMNAFSKSAVEKIEAAGGKTEVI